MVVKLPEEEITCHATEGQAQACVFDFKETVSLVELHCMVEMLTTVVI